MGNVLLLLAGLAALYFGAEWLVRGAGRLAYGLGLTPLVIGLTVVAFGTSAPELAVSVLAAWQGRGATALGNVVGSNIANVGLILALAALVAPLRANLSLLRREAPIMVAVSVLVFALAFTGGYSRGQGALLLLGLIAFTGLALRWARAESAAAAPEYEKYGKRRRVLTAAALGRNLVLVAAGIAALVLGGRLLVASAVEIAGRLGVSEMAIAATVVAVGTSLPELATSVVAAARGESDIALGNVVGSNIYNLLGVLGLSALARPIAVPAEVLGFELLWMVGFSVVLWPLLRSGHRISRAEGAALLAAYAVFVFFLLR